MPAPDTVPESSTDAAVCLVMAHRLQAQSPIGIFAIAVGAVAVLALLAVALRDAHAWPFACVALAVTALGIAERWLALRIAFDARLFESLAHGAPPESRTGLSLQAMDTALVRLGLMPKDKVGRRLSFRLDGARRLLARHTTVVALVVLFSTLALAAACWHR